MPACLKQVYVSDQRLHPSLIINVSREVIQIISKIPTIRSLWGLMRMEKSRLLFVMMKLKLQTKKNS